MSTTTTKAKTTTSKKTSTKQVKKTKPAVEPVVEPPVPTPTPEPVTEPTVDSTQPVESDEEAFGNITAKLQNVFSALQEVKSEYKVFSKKKLRELKTLRKQAAKRKQAAGDRPPSGFTKPTLISDELATFLNLPLGTEMARTKVTKSINSYVCKNNLKKETNGRVIIPDAPLKKLLELPDDVELSFFNLQTYMAKHYPKKATSAI